MISNWLWKAQSADLCTTPHREVTWLGAQSVRRSFRGGCGVGDARHGGAIKEGCELRDAVAAKAHREARLASCMISE